MAGVAVRECSVTFGSCSHFCAERIVSVSLLRGRGSSMPVVTEEQSSRLGDLGSSMKDPRTGLV